MTAIVALGPITNQLIHPWHWLTYGQNAAAVGLIVIVFYTIYTRRMMILAQQTRRGELYPNLILQHWETGGGNLTLVIMNVGAGPLLNGMQWGMQVSKKFALGNAFLERPDEIEPMFAGSLVSEATLTITRQISGAEQRCLEVVEGTDLVGGRHQFCLIRSFVEPGSYVHQVRMVHPIDFLPFWQRVWAKLLTWRAQLLHHFDKSSH
jgi:hypothetical protein